MGKVLIVDSDYGALSLFEQMLEQYTNQYEIDFIREPENAIEVLEKKDVHVLICELNMPLFSGSELFDLCKNVSPKTIRIAMTKVEDVQQTLQIVNECDLYKLILKPIYFCEDLISVIENALIYYEIQQIDEWIEVEGEERIDTFTAEFMKQQEWMNHKEATFQALREMVLSLVESDFESWNLEANTKSALIDYFDQIMHDFTECFCCSHFSTAGFEENIRERWMNEQKILRFFQNTIEVQDETQIAKLAFSIYVFLHTIDLFLDSYHLIISMEEQAERFILKAICQDVEEKAVANQFRNQIFHLVKQFLTIYFDQIIIGYEDQPYVMVVSKNKKTEEI